MDEHQQAKLEELIDYGYNFNFGDYISRGFELFQKNIGGFIGFTVLFLIIVMVASFIPVLGSFAVQLVLGPALTVGFYLVANKIDKNEECVFGDFFKGFDYVGQLALAALVMGLIMIACLLPMFAAIGFLGGFDWLINFEENILNGMEFPNFPFWAFVFVVPMIYLGVAWQWTNLFIAFYNMRFWDAMEISRKIITKQWFIIFLFAIVIGLIAGFGAIFFLVGMLVTIPMMMCAQYAAFADITQLLEEEKADIVDHLVD